MYSSEYRLSFIRDVLSRYDIEKPIIMNEGALLCHPSSPCEPEDHFRNDQANYVIRLYTRAGAAGLRAAILHTLDGAGWRDGGLLKSNQEPLPAYTALKFLGSQLKYATYIKELSTDSMEGYQYSEEKQYRKTHTSQPSPPNPLSLGERGRTPNQFPKSELARHTNVRTQLRSIYTHRTH